MTSLRRCPHCGYWLLRGTIVEEAHGPHCRKTPKVQPLRQQYREALRAKLEASPVLFTIVVKARLRIDPDQLRRVAEGRSDFSPTTWRRLAPFLGLENVTAAPRRFLTSSSEPQSSRKEQKY